MKESSDRITLYLPDGTFTEVEITRASTTVGALLDLGLEKRSRILPRDRAGFTYHLETVEEPGVRLDTMAGLESLRGSEFFIVRDNSRRVSSATHRDQAHAEKPVSFLDAPLFQSFNVQIISKVSHQVQRIMYTSDLRSCVTRSRINRSELKLTSILGSLVTKSRLTLSSNRARGACTNRRPPPTTWTTL